MVKTLAIVGGGPKAAAIVARAAILRELLGKDRVPEIYVFERNGVGAAWSGDYGFSSGFLTLCSPAEKDVGFPYIEKLGNTLSAEPIAPKLYARFSWSSFLVETGNYAEWVDRGRDHPSHKIWADYLRWVFIKADQAIVQGEVLDVTPQATGGWHIRYNDEEGEDTTYADGVVLTGTGNAKPITNISSQVPAQRIFDSETFWSNRSEISKFNEIAVAGAGGAAGAIIAWLSNALSEREEATVRSISPTGTLFARGDGYAERRWFSDPSDWRELLLQDRRNLIERTEGGVISLRNKSIIDRSRNIDFVRGRATGINWDGSELSIDVEYDGQSVASPKSDCFINAIGFDPWSLLDIVSAPQVNILRQHGSQDIRDRAAEQMLSDLSFTPSNKLGTGLHVPVLAALARGPGMGTLGCLGLVASSILDGYVS